MKALCWEGVNKLSVEQVPDPQILNDQDAILKLRLGTTCGFDLHLIGGYIPAMRAGDVIGHEFMGEIVTEVGLGMRALTGRSRARSAPHPSLRLARFGAKRGVATVSIWCTE